MAKKIERYNYKRPDRVSKNQLRSLHFIHDRFARNFSSSVSAVLRKVIEVNLETIKQMPYQEFLKTASDPTCFTSLSLRPLDGTAALDIGPEAIFSMIDRLLGGLGEPIKTVRAMTEIEQTVVRSILKLFLDNLKESWRQIYPIEFAITAMETHPDMIQIVSPNEMVIVFQFRMKTNEVIAPMHFCFPTLALEPILHIFEKDAGKNKVAQGATLAVGLPAVPVKISLETVETVFPLEFLQSLREGDTLVLDQKEDVPVVLKIAGKGKLRADAHMETDKRVFQIVTAASA